MIRDIGQGRHEKRWKSGIVRVRGKAGRGGGGGGGGVPFFFLFDCFFFFFCPPPPPLPPARLPATPELFLISFSSHDLVALCL